MSDTRAISYLDALACVVCVLRPGWDRETVRRVIRDDERPDLIAAPAAILAAGARWIQSPEQILSFEPSTADQRPSTPNVRHARCAHGTLVDYSDPAQRGTDCESCGSAVSRDPERLRRYVAEARKQLAGKPTV